MIGLIIHYHILLITSFLAVGNATVLDIIFEPYKNKSNTLNLTKTKMIILSKGTNSDIYIPRGNVDTVIKIKEGQGNE